MKYSVRIDWVTLTIRRSFAMPHGDTMNLQNAVHIAARLMTDLLGRFPTLERTKSNPFYAYAFKDAESSAVCHVALDAEQQGCMVVFTGSACDKAGNMQEILERAALLHMKLTRCDIAFDIMDSGESVADLAEMYAKMYGEEPPRKTAFVHSKHGDTFYVGSRSSAKMVRIYDKAAQQKVKSEWVRVELELKQEAAQNAHEHIARYPALMGSVIAQIVGVPQSVLMQVCEDAAQGDITVRSTKPKTRSNRLVWLMKSVLPAIEALLLEEPAEFDVFSEAFAALEDIRWNGKTDSSPLD